MDGAPAAETPAERPIPFSALPHLAPLLAEIGVSGERRRDERSFAEHGFVEAWRSLASGEAPGFVALRHAVRAVASVTLGPLRPLKLRAAGFGTDEIAAVFRRALDARAEPLGRSLARRLDRAVSFAVAPPATDEPAPAFVASLLGPDTLARPTSAGQSWSIAVRAALIALAGPRAEPEAPGAAFLTGLLHCLPGTACSTAQSPLSPLAGPLRKIVARAIESRDDLTLPAAAAVHAARALGSPAEAAGTGGATPEVLGTFRARVLLAARVGA